MKFSEFRQYQPKPGQNVFVFVCEDDFLVEESRAVWLRIFGGSWVFEKYAAKEFEEIPAGRLMDEALTPSLFTRNRALLVTNAEKLTKGRVEHLTALQNVANASLKVVLVTSGRKSADALAKIFPIVEIDTLRPADVGRWLVDRYNLAPAFCRKGARWQAERKGPCGCRSRPDVEGRRLCRRVQEIRVEAARRRLSPAPAGRSSFQDFDTQSRRLFRCHALEADRVIRGQTYKSPNYNQETFGRN